MACAHGGPSVVIDIFIVVGAGPWYFLEDLDVAKGSTLLHFLVHRMNTYRLTPKDIDF